MTAQSTQRNTAPSAAEVPFEPEAEARSLLDDLLSKPSYRLRLEPQNLTDLDEVATMAAEMRLNGCQTKADAKLRMMTGAAIGLPAMASIQAIAPIESKDGNRVTMSMFAKSKLALILARPDKIEYFRPVETTNSKCKWVAKRRGQKDEVDYEFTWEDAIIAGLVDRGSTPEAKNANNYNKHPKAMLTWRCVGRLADLVAGDILHGIATREDVEDERNREPAMPPPVGAAAGELAHKPRDWEKETADITAKILALVDDGKGKQARELAQDFEKEAPEGFVLRVREAYNGAIAKKQAAKGAKPDAPKGAPTGAQQSLTTAPPAGEPYLPPNQRGDSYSGPEQPPAGWKP